MCGICGIFSACIQPGDALDRTGRMLGALRRRGPDDQGHTADGPCVLGQTRLSVIDTSASGHQPMCRDGVTLVYNGELYNFREHRRALEEDGVRFQGDSDTEVLLELYLRNGRDCLRTLRGMYAFAIFDSRDGSLFCGRDPFGIKPFLYAMVPGGIVFASELKALLASGLVSRSVDRRALYALLRRGAVPQPFTILERVSWLPAGHYLAMRQGCPPEIAPFHAFAAGALDLSGADWPELVAMGRERIVDSVRRQMVADVPLGAFLSGGIDSSLIVALMARTHGKVRAFSVGFEDDLDTASQDETGDAELVARHLGISHTTVMVSRDEAARNVVKAVRDLDHPSVDGLNAWFVSRAAAGELTVALSGTGGDELFAGYPWFKAMNDFAAASWPRRVLRALQRQGFHETFDVQYCIFDPATAAALCPGAPTPPPRQDPMAGADPLCRVSGMLLCGYARDQLLADIDTASMAHGLEVRVPLLDESLADFALSLPMHAKLGPGDPSAIPGSYAHSGVKRLLLEIGREFLPEDFATRAKRGFTLPLDAWLRGALGPLMADALAPPSVAARGFFSPEAVSSVRRAFLAGHVHWTRPWLLMAVELWAREVLDA